MRISLVRRDAPLDRRKAWACLALNLAACPGLGSILAGRLSGWCEIVFSIIGFTWIVRAFLLFITALFRQAHLPTDWRHHLAAAGTGLAIFALGWLWSALTSFLLLRSTSALPPVMR